MKKIITMACVLLIAAGSLFGYEFQKITHEKKDGLYWFKQNDGARFNRNKPTIILIHGSSGSQYFNDDWYEDKFIDAGWNVAFFNWRSENTPARALQKWSEKLAEELEAIIRDENYDMNEIRLMGYSWGIFPASFTAKKILRFIKSQNRSILVTVDAAEPVPYWGGYITDDEGNTRWGVDHVKENMKWVAANQVVQPKAGHKLFKAVYVYYSWSDAFTDTVKPAIKDYLKDKWYGTWEYASNLKFTQDHQGGHELYLRDYLTGMSLRECRFDNSFETITGDFNGDGQTDIMQKFASTVRTLVSTTTGSYSATSFIPWPGYALKNYGEWKTGDVNGDGKTDLIHLLPSGSANTWLSQGNGKFGLVNHQPVAGYIMIGNGEWKTGDFNGDGKTDLLHLVNSNIVHTWISLGNGKYDVKNFNPPNGYLVNGNGDWEVGDFNGDGKSDLVHLVKSDIVHTWLSYGNGSFSIRDFRPPNGYDVVGNGDWKIGDFNGDGRSDLVHLVKNNYVHTWLSYGNGQYSIQDFRPPGGYVVIGNGEWKIGDFNSDGRTDLIHMVRSDYVHPWISNGNGSFQIKHFRPWSGYGIASGSWVDTVEFDRNSYSDMLHIVNDRYCHTWKSKGDGTFAIGSISFK